MLSLIKKWLAPVHPMPAVTVTDEEIPRYPPFAKGLPAAPVDRILATQSELVSAIRHTLALPGAVFETVAWPVIERYAAFTHLLPASEAHHHRGAGGLFRHGLEVAQWALMASEGVLFEAGATPCERKQREPKWRLAVCLGGLLHDIGKPVSDLSVVDRDGGTQWNPYVENLNDWAEKNGIDHYFLRWRDKRHQRHEQFSVLVTERVLTADCLSYLTQHGPEIMQSMLEAIAGVDRGTMFHTLVLDADRKSVERDLRANHIQTDASLGVPVEKYLLDAMRRLVSSGRWSANVKGARVWRFESGLHVVWKAGAQDVIELLAKDRVAGIPRDPDTLADILLERGLAVHQRTIDGRAQRYWRMAPVDLGTALYMLRMTSPDLLYSGEPPIIVDGVLVPDGVPTLSKGKADSSTVHRPTEPPDTPDGIRDHPSSETDQDWHAKDPELKNSGETGLPAAEFESHYLPDSVDGRNGSDSLDGTGAAKRTEKGGVVHTKSNTDDNQNSSSKTDEVAITRNHPSQPSAARSAASGRDDQAIADPDKRLKSLAWFRSKGAAGAWMLECVAALDEMPSAGRVPMVDEQRLFLPHPDAARQIGREPDESLRVLDAAGWIETDIKTPMLKVRIINGAGWIVLKREVARMWLTLVGEMPANQDVSSSAEQPPPLVPEQPSGQTQPAESTMKLAKSRPKAKRKLSGSVRGMSTDPKPALPSTTCYPPAEDLVRLIQGRVNLPCAVTDNGEWLTVPYSILDWYTQQHPGVIRTQLIIGLHRHADVRIDGNSQVRVHRGRGDGS